MFSASFFLRAEWHPGRAPPSSSPAQKVFRAEVGLLAHSGVVALSPEGLCGSWLSLANIPGAHGDLAMPLKMAFLIDDSWLPLPALQGTFWKARAPVLVSSWHPAAWQSPPGSGIGRSWQVREPQG